MQYKHNFNGGEGIRGIGNNDVALWNRWTLNYIFGDGRLCIKSIRYIILGRIIALDLVKGDEALKLFWGKSYVPLFNKHGIAVISLHLADIF